MASFLEKSGLLRAVLDAMPLPVFIVDRAFRLLDRNPAGEAFIGAAADGTVRRLCGDELHCINALSSPGGCGTSPACPGCVLRGTVTESVARAAPVRKRWVLERRGERGPLKQHLFVTAADIPAAGEPLLLLVFEDVTEFAELRGLVPICAGCKKIRSDRDYWEQVEHYLARHLDMSFTHGMCPDCLEQYFPEGSPGRRPPAAPPPAKPEPV